MENLEDFESNCALIVEYMMPVGGGTNVHLTRKIESWDDMPDGEPAEQSQMDLSLDLLLDDFNNIKTLYKIDNEPHDTLRKISPVKGKDCQMYSYQDLYRTEQGPLRIVSEVLVPNKRTYEDKPIYHFKLKFEFSSEEQMQTLGQMIYQDLCRKKLEGRKNLSGDDYHTLKEIYFQRAEQNT